MICTSGAQQSSSSFQGLVVPAIFILKLFKLRPAGCCCNREIPVGELVNLKKFKKRQERERANIQASSQRAKHGLTKAEKNRQRVLEHHVETFLNQHLRDDGKPS